MHIVYFLATFFTVAVTADGTKKCFVEHGDSIPISSTCANKATISECLSHMDIYEEDKLQACYEEAGCSPEDAEKEIMLAMKRCRGTSEDHELKRRDPQNSNEETANASAAETASQTVSVGESSSNSQASSADATQTETSSAASATTAASSQVESTNAATAASSASTVPSTALVSSTIFSSTTASSAIISSTSTSTTTQTGPVYSDEACFETTKSWKNVCDLEVTGINTKTVTCVWAEVTSSSCSTNMICTTNARGDICMVTQGIETGGIIVAAVLGALFVMLFGGVCLASALETRRQKRRAAKAEAAAIAREASAKQAMLSDY